MTITPGKTLSERREMLKENKGNSIGCKKFNQIPSPLIQAKTIRQIRIKLRNKCRPTVRFHLGNMTKLKCIQGHSKLRHTTFYLFWSFIKRKKVKRFNDGTIFNAHVPHYSFKKPKECMPVKVWTNFAKGRPQLTKESLYIHSALGKSYSIPAKGPIR